MDTKQPTAEELIKELVYVSSYLKVLNENLKKKLEQEDNKKITDK